MLDDVLGNKCVKFLCLQVVTPHRVGDVYVYDQPNKSYQEYDVPPSRYFPLQDTSQSRTPPQQDREGNYDTPPRSRGGSQEVPYLTYDIPPSTSSRMTQQDVPRITCNSPSPNKLVTSEGELYDVPPQTHVPVGIYDMPHSNRSSTISTRSTGSTMTISSSASNHSFPRGSFGSAPPSTCGSARSSTEISAQDIYDVPPAPRVILPKHGSIDSALDIYDTPPSSKKEVSSKHYIEDYDIPKGENEVSMCSTKTQGDIPFKNFVNKSECGEIYDVPSSNKPKVDYIVEDQSGDVYDVPSSNALVITGNSSYDDRDDQKSSQQCVYDIPPQVTRDSVISSRVDSGVVADIDHRLSTCSMDSRGSGGDMPVIPYDELPLELDAAMDLLVKLQQDVHTSTTRLLSYVSSTWRKRENLEPRLYDIKQACATVKKSVEELVDFGQGALANSAKAEDKKLVHKLSRHLQPLQDAQQILIKSLDHIHWDVSKLEKYIANNESDHLDLIITQSKELSSDARALATLIQGNSTLLFRRSQKLQQTGSSLPGTPIGKPPVKPKPKWTPGKSVDKTMQERPLPAPPANERPLPPTPLKQLQQIGGPSTDTENLEVVQDSPSPSTKRRSVCRENVLDEDEEGNVYEVVSNGELDEYDYVALEAKHGPIMIKSEIDGIMPSGNHPGSQQLIEPPLLTVTEAGDKSRSTSREASPAAKEASPAPSSDRVSEPISDEYVEYTEPTEPGEDNEPVVPSPLPEPTPVITDLEPPPVQTSGLSPKFKARMEKLQEDSKQEVQTNVQDYVVPVTESGSKLVENDRQMLGFYAEQVDTHFQLLTNATDTFFSSVEYNQPPKVFIANSKFVVLAAHKLVFIADTLHRNIANEDISLKIMHCANYLCECLKVTVTATKNAALNYPAVGVVQEMVDRVVDVSHAANELKLVTFQASKL